jgi:hypothetical protein
MVASVGVSPPLKTQVKGRTISEEGRMNSVGDEALEGLDSDEKKSLKGLPQHRRCCAFDVKRLACKRKLVGYRYW